MTSEPSDPAVAPVPPVGDGLPRPEQVPEGVSATAAPKPAEPVPPPAPPAAPESDTARTVPRSPRAAIEPSEVPPPPKKIRSKTARSQTIVFLNGLFSLLTLLVIGAGLAFVYGKQRFDAPGPLTKPAIVVIPNRASSGAIADMLERAGVVSDGNIFSFVAKVSNQFETLKAGEYEFPAGASMREVMTIVSEGRAVQHRITFPEGWSSEQVVRRLQEDPVLVGKIASIPEEGSILPDTYSYARGSTTREQIIDQMRKGMQHRVGEVWAHRAPGLPLATPQELVVLASIVEKETSKADERPRVAAVFINRLRKGMRLQTDPTVLYGIYGGKAWLEGRTIMRSDLDSPNPYNTYKIPGLPPGPICNPGRAALEAVANPSRTNELFFVADGTGGHVFAETLEEHNRNVQRWRSIEQGRKAGDTPASPSAPAIGKPGAPPAAGGLVPVSPKAPN